MNYTLKYTRLLPLLAVSVAISCQPKSQPSIQEGNTSTTDSAKVTAKASVPFVVTNRSGEHCLGVSNQLDLPSTELFDNTTIVQYKANPDETLTITEICSPDTVKEVLARVQEAHSTVLAKRNAEPSGLSLSVAPVVLAGVAVGCAGVYTLAKGTLCKHAIDNFEPAFTLLFGGGGALATGTALGMGTLEIHMTPAYVFGQAVGAIGTVCLLSGAAVEALASVRRAIDEQAGDTVRERIYNYCKK